MRVLKLLPLLLLAACARPLPAPNPQQAWVDLQSPAGSLLMAQRVDGATWPDGRYFELSPGPHELLARLSFESNLGGQGIDSEPIYMACMISLRYADFSAGQRYLIKARPVQMRALAGLYDQQGNKLASGRILRCGTTL